MFELHLTRRTFDIRATYKLGLNGPCMKRLVSSDIYSYRLWTLKVFVKIIYTRVCCTIIFLLPSKNVAVCIELRITENYFTCNICKSLCYKVPQHIREVHQNYSRREQGVWYRKLWETKVYHISNSKTCQIHAKKVHATLEQRLNTEITKLLV